MYICSIRMYVHTLPLLTLGPCLVTWNSSARAREGAAQKRPEDVSANDVDVTSMMGLLPTVFGVETMDDELWILVILEWPHLRTPAQGEGPWGPHPPDSSNSCPSNV